MKVGCKTFFFFFSNYMKDQRRFFFFFHFQSELKNSMTLAKDSKAKEDEENKHSTRLKESKHKDTFNTCSKKSPKCKVKENHFMKPQNSSSKDKRSTQSCN
jgi:hypothetical protein